MRVYLFSAVALAACTSTYHPEYHPVTATSITQTYTSTGGAAPATVPAATGVTIEQPPAANPDDFFDTPRR